VFWNYRKFFKEVNGWCQGKESNFAPISIYCMKEAMGCTYQELLNEPFELVIKHMAIKRRIDHYQRIDQACK